MKIYLILFNWRFALAMVDCKSNWSIWMRGKECLVDDEWWMDLIELEGLLVVRMKRWWVVDGWDGQGGSGVDVDVNVKLRDRGKLWWGSWLGFGQVWRILVVLLSFSFGRWLLVCEWTGLWAKDLLNKWFSGS